MSKKWISLYVENEVGVLAKISSLFAGKLYNLESLTVGTSLDSTMSRMTLCVNSDEATFEQIKKQLNNFVEIIKVIDLNDVTFFSKEILYIKLSNCSEQDNREVFRIAQAFNVTIIDYGLETVILECVQQEHKNNALIELLKEFFTDFEIVRGGSVAIESIRQY